jgi:2',3'-cyclic-nucleotide 2'-phosphodiesterase (5'-nucleotidase family)/LysM repeat protein
MSKKYILWGTFIAAIIIIIILIITLTGTKEQDQIQNEDTDSNTAKTLFEDDYVPENKTLITENSTNNNMGTSEQESNSATSTNNIPQEQIEEEKEEIFLNLYITSNIKGDFTTYDYDYDKKDYDGSFSQLAKIIQDDVKEEDILLNLGDTFSHNTKNDTVESIIKSFEALNYDLWIASEKDYEILKEYDLKDFILTPNSTKALNNIVFSNELSFKDGDFGISIERIEDKNKLVISNNKTDVPKEYTINSSSETLYNIQYSMIGENNDYTVESTINKIPVKNEDRVILPSHKIEEIFEQYHKDSIEELKEIIGEVVNQNFFEEKGLEQIDSYWLKPTKITDFINEVQLYYANKFLDEEVKISSTPIYIENLELHNEISKRYINEFYPRKNTLYVVEMTGKQLKEYLEWSVEFYKTFKDEHLTITRSNKKHDLYDIFKGINYQIDISKEYGNRIQNLTDYSSKTILNDKKYLLVTNSERVENEFSRIDEIFENNLPTIILNSRNIEEYEDYYITDFIEDYIVNVKNGILKELPDQNWEIVGTNWNKIHRIKAEKIFENGDLTINNKVPLTYEDIKQLAEEIILKYTVKSGDWLLKISRIYGVDYKDIAERNNIENPDLIYPNQVFIIPDE